MPDIALAIIAFVVVIGPLILIHELGHFLAARAVGVTVLEFGIGFPPRMIKLFERNGTEFTLNWLPIGEFVRPLGEDFVKPLGDNATTVEREEYEKRMTERDEFEARLEERASEEGEHKQKVKVKTKSLMEANPWQRLLFMSAGVMANLLTGVILFTIVALIGYPVTVKANVQVIAVAPGSPVALAGLQTGDVITTLNGAKVETSQDIDDEIGGRVAKELTLVVKRGDETKTIVVKPSETPIVGEGGYVIVTDVAPGSPAANAGMKFGDRIVKVGDQAVKTNDELLKYNKAHLEEPVLLVFVRNGVEQSVTVVPRKDPPVGEGPIGATIATPTTDPVYGVAMLDVDPITKIQGLPFGQALQKGVKDTLNVIEQVVTVPAKLISGKISSQDARPASIVGISQMGASVIQTSVSSKQAYPILNFAALISIAIGLTQLLPIPGLDGGRMIFVVVEILRGKPVNQEREGMVHLIGLAVLLVLMAVFVFNDIVNPIILPKK